MAIKNNKTILSIDCDLCEIVQHVAYKLQLITGKLVYTIGTDQRDSQKGSEVKIEFKVQPSLSCFCFKKVILFLN